MRYEHRDQANRAIPMLCALVLGGIDLALVAGGPSLPWSVRGSVLALLALGAVFANVAVPTPERQGWVVELAGFAAFAIWPPASLVPGRLIIGALLLVGLLGLFVWHARQKRKALWSRG